jgi:hypothetical protein
VRCREIDRNRQLTPEDSRQAARVATLALVPESQMPTLTIIGSAKKYKKKSDFVGVSSQHTTILHDKAHIVYDISLSTKRRPIVFSCHLAGVES